ncbi:MULTISPECIES: electron transfer flavoprotein-ubiquinone oxidoreductase [unclassified Pseudomonas]|uniref:electron transfer flavoprotein-ubiquinone oxidoreductase n=1 Tax=unclassified Pseudomonas TaxID=196821 RepID=UPI00119C582C|nr:MULTISPECIES: electron transfer flavoprotein-ubiquinone oxidoreductase [unclassified Pseudomonas]TWC13954.1 electron-transferring-flavoprotein dehydrogenase [Pseudomonas sp. SJZ075]TWC19951.1 electron-transferring-flavoprotein dehydrogenase [Pseudomonas sp. SJZ074]TWC30094.1 electron-transferring-flavoprotein dehydrogenase [Pseudomonas sp. SJZ078]TWC37893.1 electron-transferring-flavoprotein dehydrogenase [Pseudomonas sp. SJZ085]TWC51126.1 electron-transferring-flavoprotein dehydrogenase [P
MEREYMEFDVVIVGAGPAGLSAACRLKQKAAEAGKEISVCVVEKGSEVGAHILSGAVFEPRALNELFPDWKELGAPLNTPVKRDDIYVLRNADTANKIPDFFVPKTMHNEGNYIISLGNLCRWLAQQAENLGVEIYPGFAAQEALFDENGVVRGIITGDLGVDREGHPKEGLYTPGMELRGKYTLFAEGCRGHIGKQLIKRFNLDSDADAQHYGIGLKEIWEIDPAKHQPGLVVHTAGWPLDIMGTENTGGSFLYHLENNQVVVGLIVDLSYSNTYLSPFDEFQRLKHHPVLKQYLEGGKRVSYGARAICKGGLNSLPKMVFKGGALIGCDLGTLNFAKIKGSHTAMKSGMLAADAVADRLFAESEGGDELTAYVDSFKNSWLYEELFASRNFGAAIHKYGAIVGGGFNWLDQNIFGGKLPFTLHDNKPDYACLKLAADCKKIDYPKPDGKISFDKLSSVFISGTNHEEEQPCHLKLTDPSIPLGKNLPLYDEPAQRYCPAGVYEVVTKEDGEKRFQINAQNCVHCKTCDIKDPAQNITWVSPEGAGGPTYPNM